MLKLSRSYIISVLLTAFMTTCVCGQEHRGGGEPATPPRAGQAFPQFQLTSTAYETVNLYDYLEKQPILLIYYRGGW